MDHIKNGVDHREDVQEARHLIEEATKGNHYEAFNGVCPRSVTAVLIADHAARNARRITSYHASFVADAVACLGMSITDRLKTPVKRVVGELLIPSYPVWRHGTLDTQAGRYLIDAGSGRIARVDGEGSDLARQLMEEARKVLLETLAKAGLAGGHDAQVTETDIEVTGVFDGSASGNVLMDSYGLATKGDKRHGIAEYVAGIVAAMHRDEEMLRSKHAEILRAVPCDDHFNLIEARVEYEAVNDKGNARWVHQDDVPVSGHRADGWRLSCRVISDDLRSHPHKMRSMIIPGHDLNEHALRDLKRTFEWSKLNADRARKGLCHITDPVLARAMESASHEDIVDEMMRERQRSSFWNTPSDGDVVKGSSLNGKAPRCIREIGMKNGRLDGIVQLGKRVSWNRGRLSLGGARLSDVMVNALIGQPVIRLVDHPFLDDSMIIERFKGTSSGGMVAIIRADDVSLPVAHPPGSTATIGNRPATPR